MSGDESTPGVESVETGFRHARPTDAAHPTEGAHPEEGAHPTNATPPATSTDLADGEWHRLHPATPVLRGGFALVAIVGIILVNLRDLWIEIIFGGPGSGEGEFLTWIIEGGFVGLVILGIVVILLLAVGMFYLSWRMHTFRITDELVEVRSGVIFRTNRRGRLDRVQGINIARPFFARLFGAAKLEISVAGQDANVPLAYLSSSTADALRRDILSLAAGTQITHDQAQPTASGGIVDRRVAELLAPELDPALAAEQSVVKMHPGRLLGSLILNVAPIVLAVIVVIVLMAVEVLRSGFWIFAIIPAVLGLGGFVISRFTRSLRYSIASTPDGIRVGFGLLSTSNETLPPGRIHAVLVNQPILWRPFGWWQVTINKASTSSAQGAAGQTNTVILPVGTLDDVRRVLELVLPQVDDETRELLQQSITAKGADGDGFTNSPRRAGRIRWFSWRRNGFALRPDVVVFRRGRIWRDLIVVPLARMQSVALSQGPINRRLALATLRVHTVTGPVTPRLGGVDETAAITAFDAITAGAVAASASDTSHRWRAAVAADAAAPDVDADAEPAEVTTELTPELASAAEPQPPASADPDDAPPAAPSPH